MEDDTPANQDTKQEPLIDSQEQKKKQQKFSRTKTMGVKVKDKKTLFQFGADGKLQEVKINPIVPEEDTPNDKTSDNDAKKFGSNLNTKMGGGGGAKSVKSGFSTATTEVAFSNYAYPKADGQDDGAVFLKIRGKPDILKKNLAVIPLLTLLLMLSGVDVLQTAAQMLSDEKSYNLGSRAAAVNTNSMTDAMLASTIVLLFGGMFYDLLGRKVTVAIFYLIGAVSCVFFPYGKSLSWKIAYYTICKIIFQSSFVPLTMNPFINDYVKVQDRGLAMGIQNFGLTVGNLLSVAVVYTLTNMLIPEYAFPVLAIMQVLWVVIILGFGMVVEPKMLSEREQRKSNKKSAIGKVYSQLKQVWKACRQDHALSIGLFAIFISRNGSMVQQVSFYNWIASYVCKSDDPTICPHQFTNDDAKSLWQSQNLIANLCAIPFVIIAGKISDKVSTKILVPAALCFQIVVFSAYFFIPNPWCWQAYAMAVPQVGTVMTIIVTMQSYVAKRCPKNIRGMIFAVIGILAALGCVSYLQTYNYLSKATKYGEKMAFGTIVIFDAIWLVVLVIFILTGKYGNPPAGTDDDEDQEVLDIRGPDSGAQKGKNDGETIVADIMKDLNRDDLQDRIFVGGDEEYAPSSRRGSIAGKVVMKRKGSINEQLLDDQDEDYDYDFDDQHFHKGSIYQNPTNLDEERTETQDGYENTGAINRDTRQRSTSYAQNNIEASLPNNTLGARQTVKGGQGQDNDRDHIQNVRRVQRKKARSRSTDILFIAEKRVL